MENTFKVYPAGDQILIREGQAPKPLDPYDYKGFRYAALSTKAFATLVKTKGSKDNAVVFANSKGFFAILDDTVKDRPQDTVSLDFIISTKCREWTDILEGGHVFNIKQLIDFLKRRDEDEIENIEEIIYAVRNFKYVSTITGDFTYDDRSNYVFSFKVKDAEGTVRIPQTIMATIEVFKDSDWPQALEIEVEVQKPKEEGEGPLIKLSCPKWDRYLETAKDFEFTTLEKELNEWLLVTGYPVK